MEDFETLIELWKAFENKRKSWHAMFDLNSILCECHLVQCYAAYCLVFDDAGTIGRPKFGFNFGIGTKGDQNMSLVNFLIRLRWLIVMSYQFRSRSHDKGSGYKLILRKWILILRKWILSNIFAYNVFAFLAKSLTKYSESCPFPCTQKIERRY